MQQCLKPKVDLVFGIVARDHNGELVEARMSSQPGSVAPELAEGIAIREALS